MTLGSLFDGIGGFPLAGVMCGIAPVWASEIEPFPVKVTAARFPDMKQLGDVTKINGAEIEPVDIITFGSPCQDLSVAGKQKGIHDGERSNLFFEAIRIIKEMRNADKATGRADVDLRPRYAVWENVPGAFSSNGGADFQAVLEAFASVREDGLAIPRPKKWNHAGGVAGRGWSLAWRVYDAQYWGVPQRRRRIYLIADFASERAAEILFKPESVRWHPSPCGTAREGTAAAAEGSIGRSGGVRCLNPWDSQSIRQYDVNGCAPNLNANNRGGQNRWGVCYALQGNGIDRADTAGCNGAGWREGEMYTLNTIDRPGVVFEPKSLMEENWAAQTVKGALRAEASKSSHAVVYPETARTFTARHDSSPCVDRGQNVICYEGQNVCTDNEVAFTLQAGRPDQQHIPSVVYDVRGNGDGKVVPTVTGDHENRVTDYTAVLVRKNE